MKTESGLYYGNVPGDVHDVLVRSDERLPAFKSALIRCLDSDRTPSRLLGLLARYQIVAGLERTGVVVSKEGLSRAANQRGLFVGFDEVLLFEYGPPKIEVPPDMFLTFTVDFNEALPETLEAFMRETKCVVAFGDGCGLNYATWDGSYAAFIEAQFPRETSERSE
jgi:hypothetical protein